MAFRLARSISHGPARIWKGLANLRQTEARHFNAAKKLLRLHVYVHHLTLALSTQVLIQKRYADIRNQGPTNEF